MNKIVIGLLVAVCLLGFALILLNERMGAEVAAPVVSGNIQQPLPEEGTSSATQQPSAELPDKREKVASEDNLKATPGSDPKTPEIVDVDTEAPLENANKALDEVLSERAAAVHAPSQQASIVQQTSVADLVAETPQLPKIAAAIPVVSEPQSLEEQNVQQSGADKDQVTGKQPASTVDATKKQTVKPDAQVNKDIAKEADPSKKNEMKAKESAKPAPEVKTENNKISTSQKNKSLGVTLFTVFTRENGATVRLRTNAALPYSSAQLQNPKVLVKELQKPDRVMFDLTGIWDIKEPAVPNNVIVNKVRVGKMADRARIVVDLKDKPKRVRVKIADKKDGLDIFLDR